MISSKRPWPLDHEAGRLSRVTRLLITAQLKSEKTGKETADWDKSVKEAKVRVGL